MSLLSAGPGRLDGRYDVVSVLGAGGMADVYLARDLELGKDVAVKVLRDVGGTSRFRAEARTLARLRHPSLVDVLDLGEVDGRPYLVLELVEGTSLAERCRSGPLAPPDVAAIGAQVASALAYVHGEGVVHRDVSPGNVLVAKDGRAHLADFGIARLVEDHPTLTAAGETLGTIPYLAPEQVRGEQVTPATDVYSLGLVLLEALTCRRAFEGLPTEAAVARLQRDPEIPADLPPEWAELLRSMTARAPADRPGAAVVQDRLARLGGGVEGTRMLTVPVRVDRPVDPAVEPPVEERRLTLVLAAGVAVLVVAVLAVLLGGGGGSATRPSLPANVPPGVATPLQHLHDAVDGR